MNRLPLREDDGAAVVRWAMPRSSAQSTAASIRALPMPLPR